MPSIASALIPSRRTPLELVVLTARLLVTGLIAAYVVAIVIRALGTWTIADMDAYWMAALRLREGDPLFPPVAGDWLPTTYHYSPWFAAAWAPITFLPYETVRVAWSLLLVGASAASMVPFLRARRLAGYLAAALLGSYLLATASGGNVQPLVVAALVYGVDRRGGPLAIAFAASLKWFPLLFALVYLGRRQWDRLALTILLSAALLAPFLTVDLAHYPRSMPDSASLAVAATPVWIGLAAVAVTVALAAAARRSRMRWLAAALAVMITSPRLIFYDATYLLVAHPASSEQPQKARPPTTTATTDSA